MNCPACKEALIVLELDEVEIDHCLSCQGIWLDAGELQVVSKLEKTGLDKLFSVFKK